MSIAVSAEMDIAAPAEATTSRRIDPVTASVIQGALENIAVEMGYKLMRMSYSSIIRSRRTSAPPSSMRRAGSSANPCSRRRCSRGRSPATCAAS
jgi:hypothetical protein